VPIFEQIVQATAQYASQTPLNPPSPEAKKELIALPIDLASGNRVSDRRPRAFTEYFRLHDGQMDDTQFNIVSQDEVAIPDTGYAGGYGDGDRVYYPSYPSDRTYYPNSYGGLGSFFGLFGGGPSYVPQQRPIPPSAAQPNYGSPFGEQRSRSSSRRADPYYPYRGQRY
jgi:penicillin-binding protein 1A